MNDTSNPNPDVFKILLIEDNPMDVALIQEMLRQAHAKDPDSPAYEFRHASSLAAAANYWKSSQDLILLDLSLPDSHGIATFMRVEALAGDTAIVVLSGLSDETLALEAVRSGAQDYLVKWQMGSRTLSRVLRYALERKKAERNRLVG
jgi:CheY-like chemotaxis protein